MSPPAEPSATATVSLRSIRRAAIFSASGSRLSMGLFRSEFDPPKSAGWRRRHSLERQLLQAGGGLRDVDVAFGIGRDVVPRPKLARDRDLADDVECLAVDHDNGLATTDIKELLLGVGRQREVARERRGGADQLLYEFAVARKHLDA